MALLGFSILEILPGSELNFDSNQASELGGAIYYAILHLIKLSLFFLTSVLSLRRHNILMIRTNGILHSTLLHNNIMDMQYIFHVQSKQAEL